jgi:hypothetical protein
MAWMEDFGKGTARQSGTVLLGFACAPSIFSDKLDFLR